jgi:hypothetical protein
LVKEFHYRKKQNHANPSSAFHCGVAVRKARFLLETTHPGDEDRRTHHFAIDYVLLNSDWPADFLMRHYEALEQQEGVSVFPFPEALEYYETHGWNSSKWKAAIHVQYSHKWRCSKEESNGAHKVHESSVSTNGENNINALVAFTENTVKSTNDNIFNATKENNVNSNG